MRRHSHIMKWTSDSRTYRMYRWDRIDPWADRVNKWCYKSPERNWKYYRKTQYRGTDERQLHMVQNDD